MKVKLLTIVFSLFCLTTIGQNNQDAAGTGNNMPSDYPKNSSYSDTTSEEDMIFMLGKENYNKKEFKTAVNNYRYSANKGHSKAQCDLGYMYEMGLGVTKDYHEAVLWYRKSADQGGSTGFSVS